MPRSSDERTRSALRLQPVRSAASTSSADTVRVWSTPPVSFDFTAGLNLGEIVRGYCGVSRSTIGLTASNAAMGGRDPRPAGIRHHNESETGIRDAPGDYAQPTAVIALRTKGTPDVPSARWRLGAIAWNQSVAVGIRHARMKTSLKRKSALMEV